MKKTKITTHVYHPVFQNITLCGLDTDEKNGARAVYVGAAFNCGTCRNVLTHFAAAYRPRSEAM